MPWGLRSSREDTKTPTWSESARSRRECVQVQECKLEAPPLAGGIRRVREESLLQEGDPHVDRVEFSPPPAIFVPEFAPVWRSRRERGPAIAPPGS